MYQAQQTINMTHIPGTAVGKENQGLALRFAIASRLASACRAPGSTESTRRKIFPRHFGEK